MPPSADRRAEIVEAILALERSCLTADPALAERCWPELSAALGEQARLTSLLAELFAHAPECGPEQDARVRKRLHGILQYREDQLRRLRDYRDEVDGRLRTLGKMRAFSRALGISPVPARILNAQQ
jgi:hypothetical protein